MYFTNISFANHNVSIKEKAKKCQYSTKELVIIISVFAFLNGRFKFKLFINNLVRFKLK